MVKGNCGLMEKKRRSLKDLEKETTKIILTFFNNNTY